MTLQKKSSNSIQATLTKLGISKKSKSISQIATQLKDIDKALIILLDCSGSMKNDNKLITAWKALKDELITRIGNWNLGIMQFPSRDSLYNSYDWIMPPETTSDLAISMSNQMMPIARGGTPLKDALMAAYTRIEQTIKQSRILIITDGRPDTPPDRILELASSHDIPIDTIGIGNDHDVLFLTKLSEITGGMYKSIDQIAEISLVLEALAPVNRPVLSAPKE